VHIHRRERREPPIFAASAFVFCGAPVLMAHSQLKNHPVGAFFIKAFDPALTLGNHTRIESFMLRQAFHDQPPKR
jgi:hypothetical protein